MLMLYIHSFVKSLLPYIALLHRKNWLFDRREYPQLWHTWSWIAPRGTRRRELLYRICGILTGHEISKTEWGYGGGNFVDRHCRWCDKLMRVHKLEDKPPDSLQDLVGPLGFYDK